MMGTLLQAAQKVYTDGFNQANNLLTVNPNWTTPGTSLSIVSNKISFNTTGDKINIWRMPLRKNYHYCQLDSIVLGTSNDHAVCVGVKSDGTSNNGYLFRYVKSNVAQWSYDLYRQRATTGILWTTTTAPNNVTGIRIEVRNNVITLLKQVAGVWSIVNTVTDNGTQFYGSNAYIYLHNGFVSTTSADNFRCGDL